MTFTDLTLDQARAIIGKWQSKREAQNLAFLHGDHWQRGDGWIGPMPESGDASALAELPSLIEKEFVSNDVLGEIVWRAAKAATARPPRYGSTLTRVLDDGEKPTDAQGARIAEMDGLAADWLSDATRFVWSDDEERLQCCDLKEFLYRVAAQLTASRRAVIRMFVPPDNTEEVEYLGENGEPVLVRELAPVPIGESLGRVHFELCPLDAACVHTPRRSMAQIGLVEWADESGAVFVETSFLDADGQTVVRVVSGENADEMSFDLGGQLMHLQLFCDGLLKPSLISQQKDINRRLTMSGRSSNLAGFPQHVLLDAELPGREVTDPKTGEKMFVPSYFPVGAGTMNNFVGVLDETDRGEYLGRRAAQYMRLDPIDTTMFDRSIAAARERMLGEAHQSYALMAGDATASAISRETAQSEFRVSIQEIADKVTRALLWICNAGWLLGLQTSSANAADYAEFDFTGEVVVYNGPRSNEARVQDRADVEGGFLSLETKMAREGIDDIDAERARIAQENTPATALQVRTLEDRATLAAALRLDFVNEEIIWRRVWGFDDAQIEQLKAAKQAVMFGDGQ